MAGQYAPRGMPGAISGISGGGGGGRSIVTGKKSSVSKKTKEKLKGKKKKEKKKKDKDNGKKDEYILYITKRDGTQMHDMVHGSKAAAEAKAHKWMLAKGGSVVKSVNIRKYGSDTLGKHPKGNY